jgi:diguanylate cyclase (GGDEF)-like protein/PAS domain S-box-containing protein
MERSGTTKVDAKFGGSVRIGDNERMEEWPRVLERAVESTRSGVLITDPNQPDNPIVYANPAFERITGYSSEEVLGRNCRFLQGHDRDQSALEEVRAAIREGRDCQVVVRNYRKNGALFWQELSISPVRDDQGRITHFVGIQDDVTDRKLAEERLAHQAVHDPLTDLPNRVLFMDRLRDAYYRGQHDGDATIAVLFLDLDDFKGVNETLGYRAGDLVLATVAGRVEQCLREEDTVARLGGDEFIVLLERIDSTEDATRTAEKILRALRKPFELGETERSLTVSIGVALSTPASENVQPHDLLRFAELSMYRAKRNREASYSVFESGS